MRIQHYDKHEWDIVETGFHPEMQKASESIFSLGNGRMGQRANFEEQYSGESLQGNYIGGVYYPDKTRVGWWKNGYPEYFAKVLNAANWIGIHVRIKGENLDLAKADIEDFKRTLHMKEGFLERRFVATMPNGVKLKVKVKRFLSMNVHEAGLIKYSVTPLNYLGKIEFDCFIDGDVSNEDSNYNEKFWDEIEKEATSQYATITMRTKKTEFYVCTAQKVALTVNGQKQDCKVITEENEKYVSQQFAVNANENDEVVVYKYAANVSSLNHEINNLKKRALKVVEESEKEGFDSMLETQKQAWAERWKMNDIVIEGDVAAQQAIRFNIFQLNQTYTGDDPRLNIGPKGFTGEKYGGSTYWDTEAYCLPFYMLTAGQEVARNLLLYRYRHLQKAIENAEKLGFHSGAALYPMVTMNGEECHNEWEITFEEVHRNGAIAYAIFNYINHTGDSDYLKHGGLEVLVAIARFWKQRFNWSKDKKQYVMLGVTGPNEYENNVNNNWYTNYVARWSMQYAIQCIEDTKSDTSFWNEFIKKSNFKEKEEIENWKTICGNIYFPTIEGTNIFLQQDGFLDKEDLTVSDLNKSERPINQHWSWDRILRSIFIKQADVLQGIYFFEDHFTEDEIRENFEYYEPRTVHESSLSPCVHAVIAAKLGLEEKAYEMYLRTSRLDLDDYNHEVHEGLHITSMAGTWMAVVEGFGGKRIRDGKLAFNPVLPKQWSAYQFNLIHNHMILSIRVAKEEIEITTQSKGESEIYIGDSLHKLTAEQPVKVKR